MNQEDEEEGFTSYSGYLLRRYGKRVYRVAVDAGFSCPNRGANRNSPGCIYCDDFGARAAYLLDEPGHSTFNPPKVAEEIRKSIGFLRGRYGAEVFLLYLQAFSNTHAPPVRLKEIYDFCLSQGPFSGLIVSTRPDCVSKPVVELLSSYKERGLEVWVELGLQSSRDETLLRINRGHTVAQFLSAFNLLKEYQIPVAVHLIFGLPGEGWPEIRETILFLNSLNPEGVKIHNLTIPCKTPLGEEYLLGEIVPPGGRRHLENTIKALELLKKEIIVMRLTCDVPKSVLAGPRNFWKKGFFYDKVRKEMKKRKTWQGRLCGYVERED